MLELPLPVVDVARAHAVFDDQFSHANAAALSFPESHWRQLEGPFLAGLPFRLFSRVLLFCISMQHNNKNQNRANAMQWVFHILLRKLASAYKLDLFVFMWLPLV